MILKGSQRGGAGALASHLLKTDENEHVELHEVRGFVAEDLEGALHEAYAVSRATRCRQFLFSVSLSPPEREHVDVDAFERAADAIEAKLGLTDQPRVIVFHEKEGRRHAHAVWSRIDAETMTAINLPHFKLKLRSISKELYLEHGWRMPLGLVDSKTRDPANFSREEWQQARRAGHDAKVLKDMFQECWSISDGQKAFANALLERGYHLARGDRRGFVAVDYRGEVYAISRWCSVRTKQVKEKLGEPSALPDVETTKARIAARMNARLRSYIAETEAAFSAERAALVARKADIVQAHRAERSHLKDHQTERALEETNERSARLPRGLKGIWSRLTGRYRRIREENEQLTAQALIRDRTERQEVIDRQLSERRTLQKTLVRARDAHVRDVAEFHREVAHYMEMGGDQAPALKPAFIEAVQEQRRDVADTQPRRTQMPQPDR